MTRISSIALTIAVSLGVAAMVASSVKPGAEEHHNNIEQATEGAFRDGLYLGRLSARNGQRFYLCSGRWPRQNDRERFAAGYRQGYHDFLASHSAVESSTAR